MSSHASIPPADRTRVAAYAVCRDKRGRVLLCHIHPSIGAGDLWTLPGGGLEFGEPPGRAVIRELEEETGLCGEIEALLDITDRLFDDVEDGGGRLHAIRILYAVRIVGGELRDEQDGSTDRCCWVHPRQAARLRLGELARRTVTRLDRPRPGLVRPGT